MMPLSLCDKDTPLQIAKITGGEKMRTRLAELGFFPQAKLVVRQKIAENLIVEVKGTRLAIDASMARRILMEECPH